MEDPRNYAYDQVLERLNEFFAVPDYVNKVVPRTDLAELGLITGEGLDKYLLTGFSGKDVEQKPDVRLRQK